MNPANFQDFIATLLMYGDPMLGLPGGNVIPPSPPLPRYRATRRGNVYDDFLDRTVESTWGRVRNKDRVAMAQEIADRLNTEQRLAP